MLLWRLERHDEAISCSTTAKFGEENKWCFFREVIRSLDLKCSQGGISGDTFLRNLLLAPIVLSSSIVCCHPSFTTYFLSHLRHSKHSTQSDCSYSWFLRLVLSAQRGRHCHVKVDREPWARSLLTSWLCRKGRVTMGAIKRRQRSKPEGCGFVWNQPILLSQPSYFKAEGGISTGRLNLQGKGFLVFNLPSKTAFWSCCFLSFAQMFYNLLNIQFERSGG